MTWDVTAAFALIEKMWAHRGDFTSVEVKRGTFGLPPAARIEGQQPQAIYIYVRDNKTPAV